jgi:tetratricopeptide (TPR) repeat protein
LKFVIGYKETTGDMKNAGLFWRAGWCATVLIVVATFFSGCSQQVTRLDERDFRDPLIRKAQSKIRQGDKDGAILSLNKALERRPDLAQAHLELALLYDDYKKDYVGAIYHYQRYLELRPAAQKRRLIEDLIRKAKMSFAASVSEQFPETGKKMQALEEENRRLKVSLREVRENLAKRVRNPGFATQASAVAQRAMAERGASEGAREAPPQDKSLAAVQPAQSVASTSTVYYVQEGDTLSLIAGKVYNNPKKWKVILDANSAQLASPDRLKSGQILTIPKFMPQANPWPPARDDSGRPGSSGRPPVAETGHLLE